MRRSRTHSRRFAVAALCLAATAACGGGGGAGESGPAPFRVETIDPWNGETNVGLRDPVTVTFTLPVAPATVGPRPIDVGIVGIGGVPGTAAIVPDGTGRTIRFTPSETMVGGENHAIFLSASLRSTQGDVLGPPTSFQFRTVGGLVLPRSADFHGAQGLLSLGRRGHTATLLGDGRVLIAGGFTGGTVVTDRAEVYDPFLETSTLLSARMAEPRAQHTATVLADGRVLLVGGYYESSIANLGTTWGAEVFDPVANTFTAVGHMSESRVDHAALRLPDGRVLVTGGSTLAGGLLDLDTAEVFDPFGGEFDDWPNLLVSTRATHGMIDLMDGRFLLAGGAGFDLRQEVFSTATGLFTPLDAANPDYVRYGAAFESFADLDVAVVGGDSVGTVLHVDRASGLVVNTGSGLNRPRSYGTATRYAPDRILVVGGIDFSNSSFVLSTVDVIIQGGVGGSLTYATTARFPTGMAGHTATRLLDGRIVFCGGLNASGGSELRGIHVFTPP